MPAVILIEVTFDRLEKHRCSVGHMLTGWAMLEARPLHPVPCTEQPPLSHSDREAWQSRGLLIHEHNFAIYYDSDDTMENGFILSNTSG